MKKIIFDFDHTLFSAKTFYGETLSSFRKIGVDDNLFQKTFKKSKGKGRDYKPEKQFELIHDIKPQIKIANLRKVFSLSLKRSPEFVYEDVLGFLKKWKNQALFFMLSYGEDSFQRKKINAAKISRYFKKIIITKDINKASDLGKIIKNGEGAVFVEDNPKAIFEIKEAFPFVIAVRMMRGEGKYAKDKDNRLIDFSVKNLKELEKILNNEDSEIKSNKFQGDSHHNFK